MHLKIVAHNLEGRLVNIIMCSLIPLCNFKQGLSGPEAFRD